MNAAPAGTHLSPPEDPLVAALDGIGEAFYAVDSGWRFTIVNRAAEAYFDRPRSALLGRGLWDVFPESDGSGLALRFREVMRSRQPATFETISVAVPDRHLEVRLFPYGDGIGVSFRDWTERRAAERALRASEARLRLAVEAGRLAVWEYDLATETLTGSPELNALLGFPRDAAPSLEELRAGYEPGEQERVQAAGQAALAARDRFFQVEYRYRRRDGPVVWLLLRAEIHLDPGGRPQTIVGVLLDVTARRNAEEALRESQARLALAADAAELGIWDWDLASGRFVYSDRARAIFGFPPEGEVTLAMVRSATHPEDLPRTSAMAARALDPAIREREPYEYRALLPDGSVRWVLANGEAVFGIVDGEERALRYVGTVQDITARKRADEALRETQARLTALADNLPLGMVYQIQTARDGSSRRFLYVSRSSERVNGVTAEAALADPRALYDLVDPADVPRLAEAEREAILARKPFDLTVGMRHARTGETHRFRIISAPRNQPGGDIVWDGIQIDVTDWYEAEAALRESEARVTALADNLPLGMVYQTVISPDQQQRHFLYLSKSCERMNGITAEEAIADPSRLYALIEPAHMQGLLEREAASMGSHSAFEYEVAARHAKTGERRWFRLMSAPRRTADGEVIWDGIQIDITERKIAEEGLRLSEERLRRILNEMPVGVVLARMPDGEIVFQNARGTDLLGRKRPHPSSFAEYGEFGAMHPDGRLYAAHEYPLARTVQDRADIDQEEMTYRRPDGRIMQFSVSSAPIQGVGDEGYAVVAFHDVSERKRAEQHRELLINELNHRVKNTLATVQSIAAQSFKVVETSRDPARLAAARRFRAASLRAGPRPQRADARELGGSEPPDHHRRVGGAPSRRPVRPRALRAQGPGPAPCAQRGAQPLHGPARIMHERREVRGAERAARRRADHLERGGGRRPSPHLA
jgi:PAS domain S-box-containing protein